MDDILFDILGSWQVKTVAGLVLIDVVLGVAAAIRAGIFDWQKLADFYLTNVLPYILGYAVFFVAVNFVIPPEGFAAFPPEVAEWVNEAVVDLALATLLVKLGLSIADSARVLYGGPEAAARLKPGK